MGSVPEASLCSESRQRSPGSYPGKSELLAPIGSDTRRSRGRCVFTGLTLKYCTSAPSYFSLVGHLLFHADRLLPRPAFRAGRAVMVGAAVWTGSISSVGICFSVACGRSSRGHSASRTAVMHKQGVSTVSCPKGPRGTRGWLRAGERRHGRH